MEFSLKFEISDGKNLRIFGGRLVYVKRSIRNVGANFREHFGNFASNFASFCGKMFSRRVMLTLILTGSIDAHRLPLSWSDT